MMVTEESMFTRLTAAGIALSATCSLVWAMASVGYPQSARAAPMVLAQACR
jgi:hypothetical protein